MNSPPRPYAVLQACILTIDKRHGASGVSISAGLPTWAKLLENLACEVGLGPTPPANLTAAVDAATAAAAAPAVPLVSGGWHCEIACTLIYCLCILDGYVCWCVEIVDVLWQPLLPL